MGDFATKKGLFMPSFLVMIGCFSSSSTGVVTLYLQNSLDKNAKVCYNYQNSLSYSTLRAVNHRRIDGHFLEVLFYPAAISISPGRFSI